MPGKLKMTAGKAEQEKKKKGGTRTGKKKKKPKNVLFPLPFSVRPHQ
jgi:hypothetical protein